MIQIIIALTNTHTLASVATLSAASAITPSVWKANTHNSLVQTHGYKIKNNN